MTVVLAVSGVRPYDRLTWFLEVLPILVVLPVLLATRTRYALTDLLYALIFLHALILIAGGHWTYARVPLGFRLEELFSLQRNPYDKIGHFAQGFVPAIAAREILIRGGTVRGRKISRSSSFRSSLRSARATSSSSGERRSRSGRAPTTSSAPRATRGTRSRTCSSPSWAARSRS